MRVRTSLRTAIETRGTRDAGKAGSAGKRAFDSRWRDARHISIEYRLGLSDARKSLEVDSNGDALLRRDLGGARRHGGRLHRRNGRIRGSVIE
jgi:hypothetical protein